jgi:hypothetical protein
MFLLTYLNQHYHKSYAHGSQQTTKQFVGWSWDLASMIISENSL